MFGKRLKAARESKNLTMDNLVSLYKAKFPESGLNKGTLSKYENEKQEPMVSTVKRLAEILEVSIDYLTGKTDFSAATSLPKNAIPIPSSHLVPVIGTIACGTPILAEKNIENYKPCPDYVSADFALHCRGDSMINARINDGDTVFIKGQPEVENGEIAAVEILDGEDCDESCEATLKRFYRKGNKVMLSPENANYEPLIFVGEEINSIKIIGKAVYFISEVK